MRTALRYVERAIGEAQCRVQQTGANTKPDLVARSEPADGGGTDDVVRFVEAQAGGSGELHRGRVQRSSNLQAAAATNLDGSAGHRAAETSAYAVDQDGARIVDRCSATDALIFEQAIVYDCAAVDE